MAIKLTANYSKRLGLPGFSSHQFEVCVETEISSIDDIAGESARLYQTLQNSVDEEIQQRGFVPDEGYGKTYPKSARANGHTNGNGRHVPPTANGNGTGGHSNGSSFLGKWQCTDKQQSLILRLVDESELNKQEIESYAMEHFGGKGVKELDKTEASELIEYLFSLGTPGAFGSRRVRKAA